MLVHYCIMYFVPCADGIPVKRLKRERLQDKAMCSPFDKEYLSWKRRIIEQAEATINSHHRKSS